MVEEPGTFSTLPDRFDRSECAFFHSSPTKSAIVDLASMETLIIYCGAGVTIDRTGVSWRRLITELLRQELRDDESEPGQRAHAASASDEEIEALAERLSPLEMASILGEVSQIHAGSQSRAINTLVPRMQTLLYRNNGWQSGVLVRNIVRLAVGCLGLGKRVMIATTNFDDYIEKEILAYFAELRNERRNQGHGEPDLPGILVRALGRAAPLSSRRPSRTGLGTLEIIYLHGRVPSEGRPSGRLVLTESAYHASHLEVTQVLTRILKTPRSGVLILGSSTSDPPLVASLAATASHTHRYALIPVQSLGMADVRAELFSRVQKLLAQRGRNFGTQFLMPDFYYQVAQFCQEVLTCVSLPQGPAAYLDDHQGLRYGRRLVAWWNRWLSVDAARGADVTRQLLSDALATIRREVLGSTEPMRVELWVRRDPEHQRQLAFWASSSDIVHDRSTLRTEELTLDTRHAAVRAFIDGQPRYVSHESLAFVPGAIEPLATSASRWRALLSVPVRINYSAKNEPVGLPVGVVTLATMRPKAHSAIPYRSSKQMESLVRLLRSVGEGLLEA